MPSEDVQGSPLTILLVEDNLLHAELVKRTLQAHQIANRLYHVGDGEAALAYLFRHGEYADPATSPRPHAVFLDLRLPKWPGSPEGDPCFQGIAYGARGHPDRLDGRTGCLLCL
jgi:CheY-like chemotaxis protein